MDRMATVQDTMRPKKIRQKVNERELFTSGSEKNLVELGKDNSEEGCSGDEEDDAEDLGGAGKQ